MYNVFVFFIFKYFFSFIIFVFDFILLNSILYISSLLRVVYSFLFAENYVWISSFVFVCFVAVLPFPKSQPFLVVVVVVAVSFAEVNPHITTS